MSLTGGRFAHPSGGSVSMTFTGTENMVARLAKLHTAFPAYIDIAIVEEADDILEDSQDNYVPVETEALRDSGQVIVGAPGTLVGQAVALKGIAHNVVISYGGEGDTDVYAIPVHEHPSGYSPPSWKGGTRIRWSKPGTGPQYLSKPLKKAQRGIYGRLSVRIGALMVRTPGAFVGPGQAA